MTTNLIIIRIFFYLLAGLFASYRETIKHPRYHYGFRAVISTVLFWPYKMAVVFWKKWRRR